MSADAELKGRDQIADVIKRKLLRVTAAIDGVRVSILPTSSATRGAEENAMIARVQKGKQRNPFYLTREDRHLVKATGKGLGSASTTLRFNTFKAIGDYMHDAVMRNFQQQRNPGGGSFKPLSKNYAEAKRRKYGFTTPILKASNQLMPSLHIRIDRVRS